MDGGAETHAFKCDTGEQVTRNLSSIAEFRADAFMGPVSLTRPIPFKGDPLTWGVDEVRAIINGSKVSWAAEGTDGVAPTQSAETT